MPDTATIEKPQVVSTSKPEVTKEISVEEFLAPIVDPKTLKDLMVNNIYSAAKKVEENIYNGTEGQKHDLIGSLNFQAFSCKTNSKDAFFTEKASNAFEINLADKDSASLKTNREYILGRLTEAEGYPKDPKVATEYTAIITASIDNAIRTIAAQVGAIKQDPKKPIEVPIVDNGKDETVKVSVPQQ